MKELIPLFDEMYPHFLADMERNPLKLEVALANTYTGSYRRTDLGHLKNKDHGNGFLIAYAMRTNLVHFDLYDQLPLPIFVEANKDIQDALENIEQRRESAADFLHGGASVIEVLEAVYKIRAAEEHLAQKCIAVKTKIMELLYKNADGEIDLPEGLNDETC